MMKRRWLAILCLTAAAGFALAGLLRRADAGRVALSRRIPNNEAVVAAVRKGLREHAGQLTLTFSYDRDVLGELPALTDAWVEAALAETDDPAEGDYIRYQLGGYTSASRCERSGSGYTYTVVITPRYYTYLVQEEEVTRRVEELTASFGFDGSSSDYEKARTVYDYVCRTVRYDRVHAGRTTEVLRSTAYAALKWHTATCQGYSVLLYRLLRTAGLDARVVTGRAGKDAFHAWNLVRIDGRYYQLDATWDAGKDSYACFLKGTASFADHVPDPVFQTAAFRAAYPLEENDFAG